MNTIKGQEILLKWFRHNSSEVHKLPKIRVVCKNICKLLGDEANSSYLYLFLYPLVRMGLVEFYSSGTFTLSPSTLILDNRKIIAVNLNDLILEKIKGTIVQKHWLSSITIHDIKYLKEIEQISNQKATRLKISSLFQKLSSLDKIISNFREVQIVDEGGFLRYKDHNWEPKYNNQIPGCFKATDNVAAKRYLRLNQNTWRTIPHHVDTPDGFNLAYCYSLILNNSPIGVAYAKSTKTLTITNIHFPIIIERLLWLTCLHDLSKIQKNKQSTRFRDINFKQLNSLNKFFLNKIKIHE